MECRPLRSIRTERAQPGERGIDCPQVHTSNHRCALTNVGFVGYVGGVRAEVHGGSLQVTLFSYATHRQHQLKMAVLENIHG